MGKLTMSVKEIASELGFSTTTVYAMVRKKEIPHAKVQGRILFHRPTVEHWLVSQTIGGEIFEHNS